MLYAITNWHVAVRDGSSVMRVNTTNGGVDILDFDPSEWEFPPAGHDLAILPPSKLGLNADLHAVTALHLSMFLSKEEISEYGIGPGEDVMMIGRFVDHDGAASNVPAARFGNISVMPQPIRQPTGATLESFVLDVHSRTGYSGSPVFVYRTFGSDLTTDQMVPRQVNVLDGRMWVLPEDHFVKVLGLHWGQFPEQWEIKSRVRTPSTEALAQENERYIEGMSGMTVAVPAWAIPEFLNMPKLKEDREKTVQESLAWHDANYGPSPELSAPSASDASLREDFTRLLSAAARKPGPKEQT
jgi:hypothetical protein